MVNRYFPSFVPLITVPYYELLIYVSTGVDTTERFDNLRKNTQISFLLFLRSAILSFALLPYHRLLKARETYVKQLIRNN